MASHYTLTVKGQPGELLRAAFEDVDVSSAPGVTVLAAELDQPALYGLLARIEDLGLELLDMRREEEEVGGDGRLKDRNAVNDQKEKA